MKKRNIAFLILFVLALGLFTVFPNTEMTVLSADDDGDEYEGDGLITYIVLVLDVSSSMAAPNSTIRQSRDAAKEFAKYILSEQNTDILGNSNPDSTVFLAVVRFDEVAYRAYPYANTKYNPLHLDFTDTYNPRFQYRVDNMRASRRTNIYRGLELADKLLEKALSNYQFIDHELADRDGIDRKIIILVSDGLPNMGPKMNTGPYIGAYENFEIANNVYNFAHELKTNRPFINNDGEEVEGYEIHTIGVFGQILNTSDFPFARRFLEDVSSQGPSKITADKLEINTSTDDEADLEDDEEVDFKIYYHPIESIGDRLLRDLIQHYTDCSIP